MPKSRSKFTKPLSNATEQPIRVFRRAPRGEPRKRVRAVRPIGPYQEIPALFDEAGPRLAVTAPMTVEHLRKYAGQRVQRPDGIDNAGRMLNRLSDSNRSRLLVMGDLGLADFADL